MAHFAKLDENNIVIKGIVINNDILLQNEIEVEQLGIDFCKSLYGQDTTWVQTSYNGNIRKQYAGIGMSYDETNDVFILPQPFDSWTLNSNFDWEAPVSFPTDGNPYEWNEETLSWLLVNPPYASWSWNSTAWIFEAPIPYPTDEQPYEWNEENQSWEEII
tara:strand:- start:2430 stop:2912 length:483 start_codon:yes stop_codon:yes gene_type:complete